MRGTWCTPELQKAVELVYRIIKIHEVWHFPEDQRKEGLFTPYVNTWLKHKTQASGWPDHRDTQEKKSNLSKISKHEMESSWKILRKIRGKKAKLVINR